MRDRKPPRLKIRWNKDLSISVYCYGKVVRKYSGVHARSDVQSFINGWFGDSPENVRWIYAR